MKTAHALHRFIVFFDHLKLLYQPEIYIYSKKKRETKQEKWYDYWKKITCKIMYRIF